MAFTAHETRRLARSLAPDDGEFHDVQEAVAFLGGSGPYLKKADYRALCQRLCVDTNGSVRVMARRLNQVGRECRNDAEKGVKHRRNFRGATIAFMDMGTSFITAVKNQLESISTGLYNIEFETGLVDTLPRENTAFVSPANGLGFMRGGIDGAYAAMFPGVEAAVQRAMKQTGHYPLPVGNGVPVKVNQDDNTWLIACPTMPRPGMMVATTSNARAAFRAALLAFDQLVDHYGVTRLVVPGMCTGIGGMSVDQCAAQLKAALDEHLS